MNQIFTFVVGTHRSGTSAVAGCLHALGWEFGGPLMPPHDDNPRGYFEHLGLVALHDRWLSEIGSSWHDPTLDIQIPQDRHATMVDQAARFLRSAFAGAMASALKDPRISRFISVWDEAVAMVGGEARWLLIVRDPESVVASLEHRDRLSTHYAESLWFHDVQRVCAAVHDKFHAIIEYDRLIAKPESLAITVPWLDVCQRGSAGYAHCIDPHLRRQRTQQRRLSGKTHALHQFLCDATSIDIDKMRQIVLEPPATSTQPDLITAQVFFAADQSGFNENNSCRRLYEQGKRTRIQFEFSKPGWRSMRFDPSERSGAIRIFSWTATLDDGNTIDLLLPELIHLQSRGRMWWQTQGILIDSREDDARLIATIPKDRCVVAMTADVATVADGGLLPISFDEAGAAIQVDGFSIDMVSRAARLHWAEVRYDEFDQRIKALTAERDCLADLHRHFASERERHEATLVLVDKLSAQISAESRLSRTFNEAIQKRANDSDERLQRELLKSATRQEALFQEQRKSDLDAQAELLSGLSHLHVQISEAQQKSRELSEAIRKHAYDADERLQRELLKSASRQESLFQEQRKSNLDAQAELLSGLSHLHIQLSEARKESRELNEAIQKHAYDADERLQRELLKSTSRQESLFLEQRQYIFDVQSHLVAELSKIKGNISDIHNKMKTAQTEQELKNHYESQRWWKIGAWLGLVKSANKITTDKAIS